VGGIVLGDRVVLGAGADIMFRGGETLTVGHKAVLGTKSVLTDSGLWNRRRGKRQHNSFATQRVEKSRLSRSQRP
jgi:acetyltransferase-like isoleucine patch superfamily enzyme